ncbi:MAG: glycosyltransferase family 39 protein [Gemmatimonadales bacterium]|nr:glycosyltransferase family 39 protein [Gemmatimonadales bacterium]
MEASIQRQENPMGSGVAPGLILAGLIALAVVLRFYRLGEWNFEGTEMFTLRDSVRPMFRNSRPLGYLLNYYVVRPFHPLDEFGLRLLPALLGVLAIPTLYLVARRLLGTRAALFSALLLTVSALHVFYSQFARYWSLVFLLSAIYPYALYLGVRQGSGRLIALGVVTAVLAILAHPVSILLVGGPAIWLSTIYLRPRYLKQAWSKKSVRWGVAVAAVLAAAIAARVLFLLQDWVSMHDQNPGMGQFLLGPKRGQGIKQMVLLTAYAESLTLPVVLGGAVGVYLLWRQRDPTLGGFLASLALFPLAFIALVSVRTAVSTFYLLPAAPVFFLGAGVFLDRLFELDWNLRPRWLAPAAILVVFIAAGVPTLVSQYRNGRRFDFRGVAHWLEPRLAQGDVVVSDQPMVLDHYMEGPAVQKLRRDPAPLGQALSELQPSEGEALWVVAPAPAHAFRTNLKAGGLADWLYENCQMRNTIGRGRLDFRQQYLQVYRCPPVPPGGPGAGSAAR